MTIETFDVAVIGAGPAGEAAATTAGFAGKRVVIIEKEPEVGGAGINTGTIPSKTLRETALALSGFRARNIYGVDLSLRREATIADFTRHERNVTRSERARALASLEGFGVTVLTGLASFVDPHTLRVEGPKTGEARFVRAETIVIATGSSPFRPKDFPFEDTRIHDSNEVLEIDRLPKRLAVVGAGVIGLEYASTFAAIGSEVHVIDGRAAILPFLDGEVAAALKKAMEANGVRFHLEDRVVQCEVPQGGDVILSLASGACLPADGVLVAAGRTSNTASLKLEAAGIVPGERGLLTVDAQYRTSVPHIYAAGDVIGHPALASTSMEQARVAMCHACGIDLLTKVPSVLPSGIYTIPEVGMVGETEETLKKQGIDYVAGVASYASTARGKIIGDTTGFVKLLFRREDMKLLGAHLIGEQAIELVHLGLFAILSGSGLELFRDACFNYPSLAQTYRMAAYDALLKSGWHGGR